LHKPQDPFVDPSAIQCVLEKKCAIEKKNTQATERLFHHYFQQLSGTFTWRAWQ